MGLGFVGSDAHWAYSGFHRFRCRLAKEIGIELDAMAGFTERGLSWSKVKDPVVHLLHHSDCDGQISAKRCALIAPRLRELVKDWPEHDYDKDQALLLARGMERCAKNNKALKFT